MACSRRLRQLRGGRERHTSRVQLLSDSASKAAANSGMGRLRARGNRLSASHTHLPDMSARQLAASKAGLRLASAASSPCLPRVLAIIKGAGHARESAGDVGPVECWSRAKGSEPSQ